MSSIYPHCNDIYIVCIMMVSIYSYISDIIYHVLTQNMIKSEILR